MKCKMVFLGLIILCAARIWSQDAAGIKSAVESGTVTPAEAMEIVRERGYHPSDVEQLVQEYGMDGELLNGMDSGDAERIDPAADEEDDEDDNVQPEKNQKTHGGGGLFGYDFFNYSKVTFEPLQNMPAPADYMIGPGDEILITMWGETQLYHELAVRPNGSIVIPNVGMVSVNGLTLENLKEALLKRMTRYYASLRYGKSNARSFLDVSLGKLKTIRVFVMGEVNKPGGYALNSLATVFTALYYSGGPTSKGSLRRISLKRGSVKAGEVDLYDYLVEGDNSSDIRLENGDIIMVPPAGKVVTLKGNVFRPAMYEMDGEETFRDLLRYAGGFTHDAYLERIHLERIVPFEERSSYQNDVLLRDFSAADDGDIELVDGDVMTVYPVNNTYENYISLRGAVRKPGVYALQEGMTISALIEKCGGLLGEAYQVKGKLVRTRPDMTRKLIDFDVRRAMEGDGAHDHELMNLDALRIHSLATFRDPAVVFIDGAVRKPGTYRLPDSMKVVDLILAAGGFKDNVAPRKKVEVYRIDSTAVDKYSIAFEVQIPVKVEDMDKSGMFYLEKYDRVFIRENPAYELQKTVQVEGEVLYTGVYPIESNEVRISDIIDKAGGLKTDAFMDGFQFKRDGKVVFIDFRDVLKKPGKSKYDIFLRNGDYLHVPKNPHMVRIAGEVMTPTLVLFRAGKGVGYYLDQAGGFTEDADKKRMQVRLANGKMWKERRFWCDPPISAGTVITVPRKSDRRSVIWEHVKDIVSIVSGVATTVLVIDRIIQN